MRTTRKEHKIEDGKNREIFPLEGNRSLTSTEDGDERWHASSEKNVVYASTPFRPGKRGALELLV